LIAATVAAIALAVAFNKVEAMRAPFLALGCRVGFGKACVKAGWIYVDHRRDDATRLLQHGCDALKNAESCLMLVDFIAAGMLGEADFARSERLCLEGGRHYALACSMLADETINGQFGDYERQKRAERFFTRACALGRAQDCAAIATVPARIGEMKKLNETIEACGRHNEAACAAMMQQMRAKFGDPRDLRDLLDR
jgi:hypothetical protein